MKGYYHRRIVKVVAIGCFLFNYATLSIFAQTDTEKKFTKEFKAKAQTPVRVVNKFGKIHVNTNAVGSVKVDVHIIVTNSNEKRAKEILESIDVSVNQNGSMGQIEVITKIKDKISNSGKNSFQINITLNVPKDVTLELNNSFGDIYLANFNGILQMKASYGNIRVENIEGRSEINLSFGDGVINQFNEGYFIVSYSKAKVNKFNSIAIQNSFSDLTLGSGKKLRIETKYGDCRMEKIAELDATASFCKLVVQDLGKSALVNMKYVQNFKIVSIQPDFEKIDIDASFSSIDMKLNPKSSFALDFKMSWGECNLDKDQLSKKAKIYRINKEGQTNTYDIKYGSDNPKSIVRIKSSYTDAEIRMGE